MKIIGPREILGTPKPPMLCEGLVPSAGITLIAGAPGVGKTWYALECALALTSKIAAFGKFKGTNAPVLYIGEDSPQWDVGAMYGKLLRGHGLDAGAVENMMFMIHQGANLNETKGMLDLIGVIDQRMRDRWEDFTSPDPNEIIEEAAKGLVILDNLRKLHAKRESNSDDMVLVMDRLRAISEMGVCIMVLHHPSKPSEFEKEGWAELRGSGEIVGGCDSVIFLKKYKDAIKVTAIRTRATKTVDFSFQMLDEDDSVKLTAVEDGDEVLSEARKLCAEREWIERQDIYQLVDESGYKGTEIARSRKVGRMLQTLAAEGLVRKKGYNRYKCNGNNNLQ